MEQNTPEAFITKWKASSLKERSAAQEHFCDLCRLLDEPTPAQADPDGSWYCFERGATKTTGSEGWADVWKRGHFAWEYKGKRKDLTSAFSQLQQYALALENPPLLVVSDMERFRVHTNWTNSVSQVHDFALEELRDANVRQTLKSVLSDPEKRLAGLNDAHRHLDLALATAYGWLSEISDEEALLQLMQLNGERGEGMASQYDGVAAE